MAESAPREATEGRPSHVVLPLRRPAFGRRGTLVPGLKEAGAMQKTAMARVLAPTPMAAGTDRAGCVLPPEAPAR